MFQTLINFIKFHLKSNLNIHFWSMFVFQNLQQLYCVETDIQIILIFPIKLRLFLKEKADKLCVYAISHFDWNEKTNIFFSKQKNGSICL